MQVAHDPVPGPVHFLNALEDNGKLHLTLDGTAARSKS
jgi:hypothetical protein